MALILNDFRRQVLRSTAQCPRPVVKHNTTRKTAFYRGSRSDRQRDHAHTRWTPQLPLASVAPHATPRRASSQLMTSQRKPTTMAINQYSQDAEDTRETQILALKLALNMTMQAMTITNTDAENRGQMSAGSKGRRTDGRTRPITLTFPQRQSVGRPNSAIGKLNRNAYSRPTAF